MNWYGLLKFLHVVSVILFIGGIFSRQLVRGFARTVDNIQVFANLSRAAGRIERVLVIPGMNAAVVLGVILALVSGAPILGFLQGAAQNWLLVSNLLLVTGMVLVPVVYLPRGKKYEPLLQAALAEGRVTPELRAALDDRVVKLAHLYEEVMVIVVVALMVFRPF